MTTHVYDALTTAIENAARSQLDDYSRQVWKAHGAGIVGDDQAQRLAEMIEQRRSPVEVTLSPLLAAPRYLIQRSPEQRSPNRRASLLRRREHAATGPLPPNLASGFTTGEIAVLRIVSDEVLAHGGVCDRSLNELGARAGVCRSIAQRTIRLAERDGLITVQRRPRSGRKHLTSIIRIIRSEWIDWLAKGRRKTYATAACSHAKPIFAEVRQVQKSTPRSQRFRNSGIDRVDKTGEGLNRTGAGRA
jgi:DNA-binding MarR family transcriptional regulator